MYRKAQCEHFTRSGPNRGPGCEIETDKADVRRRRLLPNRLECLIHSTPPSVSHLPRMMLPETDLCFERLATIIVLAYGARTRTVSVPIDLGLTPVTRTRWNTIRVIQAYGSLATHQLCLQFAYGAFPRLAERWCSSCKTWLYDRFELADGS